MESNPVYHLLIKCKKEEMKSREGDQNRNVITGHFLYCTRHVFERFHYVNISSIKFYLIWIIVWCRMYEEDAVNVHFQRYIVIIMKGST